MLMKGTIGQGAVEIDSSIHNVYTAAQGCDYWHARHARGHRVTIARVLSIAQDTQL